MAQVVVDDDVLPGPVVSDAPPFQYTGTLSGFCGGNTLPGSTVNAIENWDWRDSLYTIGVRNVGTFDIESPFVANDANVRDLFRNRTLEDEDYEPTDGWELLYRDFGSINNEPDGNYLSFGLYNRLDGRVRIFYYLRTSIFPQNAAEFIAITLEQDDIADGPGTAIFEHLKIPAGTLDDFDKILQFTGITQINQGQIGPNWYMAEGVFAYDPCVCTQDTYLELELRGTNITEVTFTIEGEGTSTAIYDDAAKIQGNALNFLSNGFAAVNGAVDSGFKRFKDVADFNDKVVKKDSTETKGSIANLLPSLVPDWFGPVGAGLKILDFFVGSKGSTTPPKLTGFDQTFSFTGTGTFTDTGREDFTIATPGSLGAPVNNPNRQLLTYDNPVGVFVLLEKPDVEVWRGEERLFDLNNPLREVPVTTYNWSLGSRLKYHVNTAAGLDPIPVQLSVSLVWEDGCRIYGDDSVPPQQDYYSVFLNPRCSRANAVTTYEFFGNHDFGEPFEGTAYNCTDPKYIQVVAVLRSVNPAEPQDIIFSSQYEIDEIIDNGTTGENPFANVAESVLVAQCAEQPFELPQTREQLKVFCETVYDPFRPNGLIPREPALVSPASTSFGGETSFTQVYPNPFNTEITVHPGSTGTGTSYRLINTLGSVISSGALNPRMQSSIIDLSRQPVLPGGIYYLQILDGQQLIEIHKINKQ